jgi:hypothetical protein
MTSFPEDFYSEQLRQTSMAIIAPIALPRTDGFEQLNLIVPPQEGLSSGIQTLGATAVYMSPGESGPLLRKAHFRNPEFPGRAAEDTISVLNERITQLGSPGSNDSAQIIAEMLVQACQETEGSSSIVVPFQVIAALGLYRTASDPAFAFAVSFTAPPFVEALMKALPPSPSPDHEPDEEILQRQYALETERRTDVEPYSEWREGMRESLARYNRDGVGRDHARSTTVLLLLPEELTHPAINARLFRDSSETS